MIQGSGVSDPQIGRFDMANEVSRHDAEKSGCAQGSADQLRRESSTMFDAESVRLRAVDRRLN